MRLQHPAKFRKLVPGHCRYCDRRFFYRPAGRPQLYCDKRCRDGEFRRSRYLTSKNGERCPKTEVKPNTFGPDFADRPLNILGGHRWGGRSIDRELLSEIISTEIGERKCQQKQQNGNVTEALTVEDEHEPDFGIPDDLSIPPFLRRVPA